MIGTASLIILYLTFIAFSGKRLLMYLHVLQQEDYETRRLVSWIFRHKVIDKRLSLALAVNGVFSFYFPKFFTDFITFICMTIITYTELDPRKASKKKLALTSRAKRIFFTAYIPLLAFSFLSFYIAHPWFWLICVQLIPVCLMIANTILSPIEEIIQQFYWNEARRKIEELQPTVIGITGSFGKTSVKHILGHILKTQDQTLITPGSVNTPMGITRIIREELSEDDKYFVVEMGAHGPGSIAKLCRLTPPDIGIITAIGHAHYERFKSLETVSKAKYELAKATLKKEGKVIVHEKTLRFPNARELKHDSTESFIVCGLPPETDPAKQNEVSYMTKNDLHIQKVEQTPAGLEVEIKWKGQTNVLRAPLYGIHHGHNMALAYAAARALGVDASAIVTAIKTVPQIPHRLEVVKMPDGVIIIDDAYNSNPLGFRSALDLLAIIKKEGGRSILITPGIVELGAAHDEIHEKLGMIAADMCDVVVTVCPKRIPTFVAAVKSKGKAVEEFATFKEAQNWMDQNKKEGDVILLENDLPDLYESIPSI